MVIIAIKQHLACPWLQLLHIQNHNIHGHTGIVCSVVVKIVHVLITQVNN